MESKTSKKRKKKGKSMESLKLAWQRAILESTQENPNMQETKALQGATLQEHYQSDSMEADDIHNIHSPYHISKQSLHYKNMQEKNMKDKSLQSKNIQDKSKESIIKAQQTTECTTQKCQIKIRECKDICTKEEIQAMNEKHNLHNKYNMEIKDYIATLEHNKHTLTQKQIKLTIQTIWNLINEAKSLDVCIEDSLSKRFLQLEYECSCPSQEKGSNTNDIRARK